MNPRTDPELQIRTTKDVVLIMAKRLKRFTRKQLEDALPHIARGTVRNYVCHLHQEGKFRVTKVRQKDDSGWAGSKLVYEIVDD